MRLINRESGFPIVEFQGEEIIFYNKFLEQEMRTLGILIPPGLRGVYHGRDYVHLDDEDFQKAFREVYYLTFMNPTHFHWVDF